MLGRLADSCVKTLSDGEMMDRERKRESDCGFHLGGQFLFLKAALIRLFAMFEKVVKSLCFKFP